MALGSHGSGNGVPIPVFPSLMRKSLLLHFGMGVQRLKLPPLAALVLDDGFIRKLGVGGSGSPRWDSGFGVHRLDRDASLDREVCVAIVGGLNRLFPRRGALDLGGVEANSKRGHIHALALLQDNGASAFQGCVHGVDLLIFDSDFRIHVDTGCGLMSMQEQECALHRIQPRYRCGRSVTSRRSSYIICELYRIFRAFRDAVKRHNCGDAVIASS